jgi:hypothetical protein
MSTPTLRFASFFVALAFVAAVAAPILNQASLIVA